MGSIVTGNVNEVYPDRRMVVFNGEPYPVGDKVNFQFVKKGKEYDATLQNGMITYFKSKDAPGQQYPPRQGGQKPPANAGASMIWSNSVNAAIELAKLFPRSESELKEVDRVIWIADKLFCAGKERLNDGV